MKRLLGLLAFAMILSFGTGVTLSLAGGPAPAPAPTDEKGKPKPEPTHPKLFSSDDKKDEKSDKGGK
jgi:hypothetical protein